jgi:PAS domain S-box-containing protein
MKYLKNIIKTIRQSENDSVIIDAFNSFKKNEEEKYISRFFELSMDMICIAGNDGYFKRISKSFSKTLGYTEKELLSQPFINFIDESDVEKTKKELQKIRKGNNTYHFENKYKCKDGSIRWLAWRSVTVPENNLVYAIARDITEQKEREKPLQITTEQLEIYKKETLESLRYACSIQEALMQLKTEFNELVPNSFILFLPKNIVSGDFYWFKAFENKVYFSVGDCTGHGIPGAMITMLGLNILHAAFSLHDSLIPSELLSYVVKEMDKIFSHKSTGRAMQDGMDITICEIDTKNKLLSVAGTNSCICLVRNGEITKIITDKYSMGNSDVNKKFISVNISIMNGDMIYLFSDGIIDQFGGPLGKKFGSKNFKNLLKTLFDKNIHEQESIIKNVLKNWQNGEEQTDDITVLGIRV